MKRHIKLFEQFDQDETHLETEELVAAIEAKYGSLYMVDAEIDGSDMIAVAGGEKNAFTARQQFIRDLETEAGMRLSYDLCDINEVDDLDSFMDDLQNYTYQDYDDVVDVLRMILNNGVVYLWDDQKLEDFAYHIRKHGI